MWKSSIPPIYFFLLFYERIAVFAKDYCGCQRVHSWLPDLFASRDSVTLLVGDSDSDTDDIVLEELLADHRDRKPRHSNSFVFEEQTDSWCIDHCRYEYSCCDICCDSLFNYICIINKPYLLDSTKLHSGGWLLRWLSRIPSGWRIGVWFLGWRPYALCCTVSVIPADWLTWWRHLLDQNLWCHG